MDSERGAWGEAFHRNEKDSIACVRYGYEVHTRRAGDFSC